MVKVRYTYRLRPSKRARTALEDEWGKARWVWNECVARSKACLRAGETCGPAKLDRELTTWRASHCWLARGSSVVQQQVVRDFGVARAKALSDIERRVPPHKRRGLPRFKAKGRARLSLNYTTRGFSLDDGGRLRLPKGVVVPVVWSRSLPSDPNSVRVYRDRSGHWSASFVVNIDVEPLPATGRTIGIDWGVRTTATTTDPAHDLLHAEHQQKASKGLRCYERQMARRRRPMGQAQSAGYKEARVRVAKEKAAVARRRADDRRKWAASVVQAFDQIAVENFRPKFLATTTMARKAADGAIAAAKRDLLWAATKHGRDLRLVEPSHTTMDCSECGARATHGLELSERTYTCAACGVSKPRDRNSAAVMVVRAGFDPAGVDGVRLVNPNGFRAA